MLGVPRRAHLVGEATRGYFSRQQRLQVAIRPAIPTLLSTRIMEFFLTSSPTTAHSKTQTYLYLDARLQQFFSHNLPAAADSATTITLPLPGNR